MHFHYPAEQATQLRNYQRSAVADKPTRCNASRRTCYKQITWMLSAINMRPTKLTTLRVVSRQFAATAPAFNLPYLHLTLPLGMTPFVLCQEN